MSELISCPYCGGKASAYCSHGDVFERYNDWFVECEQCGATNINSTNRYSTKEEAANAWNTRNGFDNYLRDVYDWAYCNMECCDEPEWSLFSGLYYVISRYYEEIGYKG